MKTNLTINLTSGLRFLGGSKPEYIAPDSIIFLESEVNYTVFYLTDGRKLLSSRNLQVHESRLCNDPNFFRIHRSIIINMKHIEKIKLEKLSGFVYLQTGKELLISRRRIKNFQERFNQI